MITFICSFVVITVETSITAMATSPQRQRQVGSNWQGRELKKLGHDAEENVD